MSERRGVRYRVEATGTTKTYVYCYAAARRALTQAEREEPGYFYFCMLAGVFSAFTVEAFLNHIGQSRVRDWDVLERKLGPRDKLVVLRQVAHWSADESKRPFQTLSKMLRLRDALAHGKTVTVATDVVLKRHPRDPERLPEPEWKSLCTIVSVRRMVEDCEAIIRDLHRQSGSSRDPFASPGHGSSGVTLIEEK
jgi:hypothetical protein